MSRTADGLLAAAFTAPPPAKRQRASGSSSGRGSGAFPLAGCLVYMPPASQLSEAGLDCSSWLVGIARLGGSVTHNCRRPAGVTHVAVPSVAPPGGSSPWAWIPAELLPGSAAARPELHYVSPAWADDCIAWRERRPEEGYAAFEQYSCFPSAAMPAHTAAAACAAAMPTPAAPAPPARRASEAPAAGTAAGHTSSNAAAAAHASLGAARHCPAAVHASPLCDHVVGAAAAQPPELAQAIDSWQPPSDATPAANGMKMVPASEGQR